MRLARSKFSRRCACLLVVSLGLSLSCQKTDEERAEECGQLLRDGLVCIEKKMLVDARAAHPESSFLREQTEETWQKYTMCKTRARDRWSDAKTRELDACKQFLVDYHEGRAD